MSRIICGGMERTSWSMPGPSLSRPAKEDLNKATRILESSADEVKVQYKNGWTPLTLAVICGQTEIANLLLQYGAKQEVVDDADTTLLHIAARRDNLSLVQLLIVHGANVNAVDRDGHAAVFYAHGAVHDYLLALGDRVTQPASPAIQHEREVRGNGITPDGKTLVSTILYWDHSVSAKQHMQVGKRSRCMELIVRDASTWKVTLHILLDSWPYFLNNSTDRLALTSDSRYLLCFNYRTESLSLLDLHTGALLPGSGRWPEGIVCPQRDTRYWSVAESYQLPGGTTKVTLALEDFKTTDTLRKIPLSDVDWLSFSQDGARAVLLGTLDNQHNPAQRLPHYRSDRWTGADSHNRSERLEFHQRQGGVESGSSLPCADHRREQHGTKAVPLGLADGTLTANDRRAGGRKFHGCLFQPGQQSAGIPNMPTGKGARRRDALHH